MKLVDAAYIVLKEANSKGMTSRQVTELAIKKNLITPKSAKPWSHMQSAIRLEIEDFRSKGKEPRFIFKDGLWVAL